MEIINKFYVVGISIRTTNEHQQSAIDIPKLWERFFSENISQKINNKIDERLYCIYTDYEKDFTKPYTTILGYAVQHLNDIPKELTALEIKTNQYAKFSVKGNIQNNIVLEQWNHIWESDIKRKYITDFEVYTFNESAEDTQIDIYISI